MGKRSNFAHRKADFYPTPLKAVRPLIPYLRRDAIDAFAEPCCGEDDLVQHLESFGLTCAYRNDLKYGQDALTVDSFPAPVVTNPPHSIVIMHPMIRHFSAHAPCWLLLSSDWSINAHAAPYLGRCTDIVPIGRVKWIKDSEHDGGFENYSWYRFDRKHSAGPVLHPRGEEVGRREQRCAWCGRAYFPQRSTSRFCRMLCRVQAHRGHSHEH
jgi:hypothetical protein